MMDEPRRGSAAQKDMFGEGQRKRLVWDSLEILD